ncbi:hydroxyacylglutathione hydrolase [Heyndrickxia sporothermodurans]|nr:hydroxyacylglutathione hydrolase [Heyndrickxia sporothermodurans]
MFFRSFFDENLAHMSYLIGCQRTGEAIIIDPSRHLDMYKQTAEKEGLTIIAVTETHIHADFVSGSREAASQFDATLYLSDEGDENWKYQYVEDAKHILLKDESTFTIGFVEFQVMHTPGHTPESISFLLTDKGSGSTEPMGIFSGDFVFVGDIGRPDLLEKAAGVKGTADAGARQMFHSLKRFKALPDYLQVWPAHGAGSACGKALGAVPVSTVGYEKINNWALQIDNEEEFVAALLNGQPEPPIYFAMMKKVNKLGPEYVKCTPIKDLSSVKELEQFGSEKVLIDTRSAKEFALSHIKGSLNIPYNQSMTNWAGWLIDYNQDIVLITQEKDVDSIRKALASIGLDRVIAKIDPVIVLKETSRLESYGEIDVHQLEKLLNDGQYHLIDVRNQSEWEEGRIELAQHIMLGTLKDRLSEIPQGKKYIVQCRSGTRSAIAASILQANGFKDVFNLIGGYIAWTKEQLPVLK